LSLSLEAALQRTDMEDIEALVRDEPSGPLQRFLLEQHLDRRAAPGGGSASAQGAGQCHGQPCRPPHHGLHHPQPGRGRRVGGRTDDLYPPDRYVRLRSREFFGRLPPEPLTHRILARRAAAVLAPLLRSGGSHRSISR